MDSATATALLIAALVALAWVSLSYARYRLVHRFREDDLAAARRDAAKRSRSVFAGKAGEQLAPLAPAFTIASTRPRRASSAPRSTTWSSTARQRRAARGRPLGGEDRRLAPERERAPGRARRRRGPGPVRDPAPSLIGLARGSVRRV